MSKRILIVEDEESIADLEKDYLELSNFEVEVANDGETGLKKGMEGDFDLIILDLMLPGVDGFEICRQIRGQKNTPIIMVSAKKDDIDKIRGLGLGADDYMTKPFSPSELVARVRVKAHLARYERLIGSNVEENKVIEIRGLKIDTTARRVWVNGEEKSFTTKEFDLLTFLAGHPRSGRRSSMIRPIRSILRRSGEWGIGLRYNFVFISIRGRSSLLLCSLDAFSVLLEKMPGGRGNAGIGK